MRSIKKAIIVLILLMILSTSAQAQEDTNYMADIITALSKGDIAQAQEINILRDAKIDSIGGYNKIVVNDLYLLSKVVYAEAGSNWLTDEHQQLVASVLINRTRSPEFPDTIEDCIYQKGQYYSRTSTFFTYLIPSERAIVNALCVLDSGSIAPASVVFQSNYSSLGSSVWKSIYDKHLGTTYFGHSYNMKYYE